jgi:3-methyladenine DNA glycosylase Tag
MKKIAMPPFKPIRARAAKRKGGDKVLLSLLPKVMPATRLAKRGDDRMLAEMAKRVFCSGFAWRVIDKKWPGFEQAFLGFSPRKLAHQPPEYWDRLMSDTRIVRHFRKVRSVEHNARFVLDIAAEHGSFARFLAAWPPGDQVGLLRQLQKRGSHLGGMTGQYFLRFVGKDCFVLSRDVVLALRDAGLPIDAAPISQRDLAAIQRQFDAWAAETGLCYTHLSRICAMSIGENVPAERLRAYLGE